MVRSKAELATAVDNLQTSCGSRLSIRGRLGVMGGTTEMMGGGESVIGMGMESWKTVKTHGQCATMAKSRARVNKGCLDYLLPHLELLMEGPHRPLPLHGAGPVAAAAPRKLITHGGIRLQWDVTAAGRGSNWACWLTRFTGQTCFGASVTSR